MTGTTETRMEEAYQILKKVAMPSESTTPDECSLYGELLATKLRSLDATTRELAMLEIDQLMFRIRQQKNYTYQAPQSSSAYNSWFGQYLQPMGYPSTAPHPIPEQSRSLSVTSQPQSSPHSSYQSDPVTPQSFQQPSPHYSHQVSTQYSTSSASTPLASPLPLSESRVPSRNEQSLTQESHEDSCEANKDQDLDLSSLMLLS